MAGKIIIWPRHRLDWHKQMALDVGLSHAGFRVGVVIGTYFNTKTGRTFVGYDTLAKVAGVSRRTVIEAVKELQIRGHLTVEVGGGRRVANEYRMAIKTVQPVAPFNGSERVQNPARNGAARCTTTLNLPTEGNSTALNRSYPDARAGGPWLSVRQGLAVELGQDVEAAWFGQVTIEAITPDEVILIAPSKFIRHTIEGRYTDKLLREWQRHCPSIASVRFVDPMVRAAE